MTDLLQAARENMAKEIKDKKWAPWSNGVGATGGNNAIMGALNKDGSPMIAYTYPCHNPIHNFKGASVMWSGYGRRDHKVGKFYLTWLIERSPWSKIPNLVFHDSPEEVYKNGFVFDGLDKVPANVLHNFLIASRMQAEWASFIQKWYELVTEYKIDEALAFAFLTVFTTRTDISGNKCCFDDKQVSVFAQTDKYDWPLDMGRATEEYVLNFVKGKAVNPSKHTFYPTADTKPVNTLWGNLVANADDKAYVNVLRKRYEKEYGHLDPTVKDISGRVTEVRTYTPGACLEILKLEQKRLIG